MKKLFFLILALLPSLLFAQALTNNFTVKGKIGNLNSPAGVFLFYQVGANRVVDSSMVVNGSYSISGFVVDPVNSFLVVDHTGKGSEKLGNTPDMLNFYLDKGITTISADGDSVYKAQITGSVINDESKYLTQQMQPLNDEAAKINNERNAATRAQQNAIDFQRSLYTKNKILQERQNSIFKNFVTTHPNSYLSLLLLNSLGQLGTEPAEMESMYNTLNQTQKDTEIGKLLITSINHSKIKAIGVIAPDFTQPDVNGNPVKLSSFRGKYVLVDFWASWCGPCRVENPNVVRIYNRFKTKNFTILGVSLDKPDGKADWLNAIKTDGLAWTQVSDLKFWGNEAAVLYYIGIVPSNILIDPNGKIIAKDLREFDLEDKLEEVLGKM